MKGKSLISILGSGSHGTLLAMLVAQTNKYHVRLLDTTEESLSQSFVYMENLLQKRISKGKIDYSDYYTILSNISVSTSFNSIDSSEFVAECVNENLQAKQNIISALDEKISKDCIILTTTASFSITKLAFASNNPSRVIGFSFFSLPTASNIVELISGLQTSEETRIKARELAESLDKPYSFSNDHPGFITNKIIFSFINEAICSLAENIASKEDIDKTLKLVTGMTLGPLELADEIGLDFVLENLKTFHKQLGDDKYKPCPLLENYVSAGWNGKKSGKGFYDY